MNQSTLRKALNSPAISTHDRQALMEAYRFSTDAPSHGERLSGSKAHRAEYLVVVVIVCTVSLSVFFAGAWFGG